MSELLLVGEASPPSAHDPQWPALLRAPSPEAQPVAVLIVEDEQIVALDLQQMLKSMGYDTFGIAASGEQALALTEKRSPDAVLMDIRLRGRLDGIETARLLRGRLDAPLLFLTAHADEATLDRAKQAEPHGYLVKPVRPAELRSALEMAVHKHRADRRLREREQWISTTLRSIADAVLSVDSTGRITFMNGMAEQLTGASAAQVTGRPAREVLCLVDSQGRPLDETPLDRALREGHTATPQESYLRDRQSGELRLVSDSAAPIIERGRVFGAVVVFRDVTENRRLQRQLEAADRMASLGTISAGVAHEINNPLAVVIAGADLLREDLDRLDAGEPHAPDPAVTSGATDAPEPSRQAIQQALQSIAEVRSAAGRISEIVAGLRTFARPAERSSGRANVARSVEWAVRATSHQLRHTARIRVDAEEVPAASVDENQLGQVLVNLLINAGQAFGPRAAAANEIRVSCRTGQDGRIVVEVTDNGVGMPPEVRERVFEPFFTTKTVDQGTGLGLSICHGIVTRAGGDIEIESRVGEGSTFRVLLLPADDALPPTSPESAAPVSTLRGRILVVDDEEDMRAVLRRVLREHDVVAVGDGRPALELLRSGERFDLILSDLMMPGMSGQRFHEAVLRDHPDEADKIVFLTAGAVTTESEEFLGGLSTPRIQKPFQGPQLRATIQALLAARGSRR